MPLWGPGAGGAKLLVGAPPQGDALIWALGPDGLSFEGMSRPSAEQSASVFCQGCNFQAGRVSVTSDDHGEERSLAWFCLPWGQPRACSPDSRGSVIGIQTLHLNVPPSRPVWQWAPPAGQRALPASSSRQRLGGGGNWAVPPNRVLNLFQNSEFGCEFAESPTAFLIARWVVLKAGFPDLQCWHHWGAYAPP